MFDKDNKKIERAMKKKLGKDYYKPSDKDENLLDDELKDRGKLVRIVCLIAVAVLLLGVIGTISIVNVTYENKASEGIEGLDLSALPIDDNEATVEKLKEVSKYLDYLGSSVNDSTLTLNTLYKDQELLKENDDLSREQIVSISENIGGIDREISSIKKEVTSLINELKSSEDISHEQYTERLSDITERVKTLNAALDNSYSDISSLIERLEGAQKSDYASLIDSLNKTKDTLGADNLNSLNTLKDILAELDTGVQDSLTSLNNDISNKYLTLNDNMESSFRTLNTDIVNNFNTTINGEDGLREYIESSFANVGTELQKVFQFVADGKKILATALATKGQTVAEDEPFEGIRNAILNIPQQLVIGVAEIPGEIEYIYHYHVDAEGNRVNTDALTASGGCYTSGYHVHDGSCARHTASGGNGCAHGSFSSGEDATPALGACGRCGGTIDCWYTGGNIWSYSCRNYTTVTYTVYDCGNSPNNRFALGCGLADGQIIGANIHYAQFDSLPESSISYYAALQGTDNPLGISGRTAALLLPQSVESPQLTITENPVILNPDTSEDAAEEDIEKEPDDAYAETENISTGGTDEEDSNEGEIENEEIENEDFRDNDTTIDDTEGIDISFENMTGNP